MSVFVNEERRDGLNPLFHRAFIVSGAIKLLNHFSCFSFLLSGGSSKAKVNSD